MDFSRKLPIGIQDFEKLRREGCLYVDKTEYVYKLAHSSAPYFLSRPRRFGKSLFLSTLRTYFEGKKEFFAGLKIETLEEENPDAWSKYPVFYFDFNKTNYQRETALEEVLAEHLKAWEKQYFMDQGELSLEERFRHLIETAVEQTGRNAVVLVDEYDKPLLETMTDDTLAEHNKAVFKGFFSTLKSYDRYLKFVFLTGVTKFSKVSIFSDLNQLQDISMVRRYSGICGVTESELKANFEPEVEALAEIQEMSVEECYAELAHRYDGYHFYPGAEGVYNPFSLLSSLEKQDFGAYWFETGTPTFLLDKLKDLNFNARQFTEGTVYADESSLTDYRVDSKDPLPLFYQTGYLTIKSYNKQLLSYGLGYPNDEVKYGFLKSLAPSYLYTKNESNPMDITNFYHDIQTANLEGLRERFEAIFARLPYTTDERPVEQNFQNVVYIVFMLLGQAVHTEIHSAKGRADVIVETDVYIYIFEFKRDGSAGEALAKIEEKGYAASYKADRRTIYQIGVNFNSRERTIDGWEYR